MSDQPLVSICMPAFNAAKYIDESLTSIFNQTYKNIEVIVVNDGSKDNTPEILDKWKKLGVTVIHQENKGQCAAANAAFNASKGDYIKFFDADDILSENFIKNQIETLKGRKEAVASAAWGRFYNDDIKTFQLNPEKVWRNMPPIDWLVESLWNGLNMMQCGLWLIPRRVLLLSGLWNDNLSLINDFDFFIRVILAAEEILFTQDAVLYYRSGNYNALSAQKSRKAYESAYLSTVLGVESILRYENSSRTRKVCADVFQIWKYQFYPVHIDLYCKAEEWIKKLGGSHYPFPAGGKTRFLSTFLGWKTTQRIKVLLQS